MRLGLGRTAVDARRSCDVAPGERIPHIAVSLSFDRVALIPDRTTAALRLCVAWAAVRLKAARGGVPKIGDGFGIAAA